MSRRRGFSGYTAGAKKPPPAHGIRMNKAGTTWWGQRWIEALEQVLRGDAGRLARGRTYARAGRAHDLVVEAGKVSAKVTGSRATPYEITIALQQLHAPIWQQVVQGMAAKAQFSAELLAGQMPESIDELFREAGVSLFPRERADLVTTCSCPDWGDPCKHVAAAHYVLGEALDRDPFLLFELRGRSREQVLAALREARGMVAVAAADGAARAEASGSTSAAVVPGVQLGAVDERDYDRPRAPLPALHFDFAAPLVHAAVVRQLGTPRAWSGAASPAELLSPVLSAAAEAARRIAMADEMASVEHAGAGGGDAEQELRSKSARAASDGRSKRVPRSAAKGEPSASAKEVPRRR